MIHRSKHTCLLQALVLALIFTPGFVAGEGGALFVPMLVMLIFMQQSMLLYSIALAGFLVATLFFYVLLRKGFRVWVAILLFPLAVATPILGVIAYQKISAFTTYVVQGNNCEPYDNECLLQDAISKRNKSFCEKQPNDDPVAGASLNYCHQNYALGVQDENFCLQLPTVAQYEGAKATRAGSTHFNVFRRHQCIESFAATWKRPAYCGHIEADHPGAKEECCNKAFGLSGDGALTSDQKKTCLVEDESAKKDGLLDFGIMKPQ